MAFTIITQGTFTQTNPAANVNIPLPSGCDYFKTTNLTQLAATSPAAYTCIYGEWFGGGETATNISFVNDGICTYVNSSTALNISSFSRAGAIATASYAGFTYVNKYPDPQAALTGTTITNASPAVATVTNTYSNGDQVVIYNAVGMEQISGMTFTISSVSNSGFTLLGLNTPGSAATAFKVRRVAPYTRVEPSYLYVTAITQASQAQVTVSQANMVYLGQKLEFTIPASYGMVQLNNFYLSQNLPVVVTSIVDAYNFTINVNTTSFTAFALPASSGSPTTQLYATVAPAGQSTQYNPITMVQTGYNFTQIPFHTGQFIPYMIVPSGALAPGGIAGDVIMWQAYKMETGTINAPVPS
jgi:hypothetical protein